MVSRLPSGRESAIVQSAGDIVLGLAGRTISWHCGDVAMNISAVVTAEATALATDIRSDGKMVVAWLRGTSGEDVEQSVPVGGRRLNKGACETCVSTGAMPLDNISSDETLSPAVAVWPRTGMR